MIYTLTLNPSIDYLVDTPEIVLGETNRSVGETMYFGGKGINVSYILKQLGISSVCLGFVAGFTGTELEKMLEAERICTDFVRIKEGNTRINVKLRSGNITEINANGPCVLQEHVNELFSKIDRISSNDMLVVSGSVPRGCENIYERIFSEVSDKGVKLVVDTSGKKLLDALKYKPFLVKPNKSELEEISSRVLDTEEKIIESAKKLKECGAVNVLVSMGDKGALLVDENGKTHKAEPIKITPINTVGAGDSMVAGFIAGVNKGYEYALRLGNACGAATAECDILANKEKIESLI